MIVRILFWLGLLPWLLVGSACVVDGFAGGFENGPSELSVGALGLALMIGPLWTVFFWIPALVYRVLFGRRRQRDA